MIYLVINSLLEIGIGNSGVGWTSTMKFGRNMRVLTIESRNIARIRDKLIHKYDTTKGNNNKHFFRRNSKNL